MKYQIEFKIEVKGYGESDEVSYLRCDDLADLRMTLETLARFEVSDVVINTIED